MRRLIRETFSVAEWRYAKFDMANHVINQLLEGLPDAELITIEVWKVAQDEPTSAS